ncbi:MAG: hypothetical protein QM532_03685 [Cyanobium sp. MAG06]|nr:hypothetical protein [Cyanobium sp. MAG06]
MPNVVNSEIVGGEHDNIIKKADDKRYGLERLLTSNSARSIVELL